jgi:hypothetical protein
MDVFKIEKTGVDSFVVTSIDYLGPDKFKRTIIDEIPRERLKQIVSELQHQKEMGEKTMKLINGNLEMANKALEG